ncbi:MAG: hypothetical protein KA965_06970 [Butyrivibrio sp.]|nr:hypothetical protein [Butyrivibrio sp.]
MKTEDKIIRSRKIAFVLNLILFVLELSFITDVVAKEGWEIFVYYTEDSNLLTLFVSTAYLFVSIITMRKKEKLPEWIYLSRYVATCCLTLTFIVVVTVLAPMVGAGGYTKLLLSGHNLGFHLLAPVISFISFVFFEKEDGTLCLFAALVPTAVYAIFSFMWNILRLYEGPYPFLMVYRQSFMISLLWIFVLLGINLLIAFGLKKIWCGIRH